MLSNDQIITRIVKNEADVSGMVAYYSHEIQKIKFCQRIQEMHNRPADEGELNHYLLTINDDHINMLRSEANRFLEAFTKESAAKFVREEIQKFKDEAEKTEAKNNKELKRALSVTKQPGYWYGVSQGIVASFCFVLIIGILAFMLSSVSIDVVGAAKWIGEHLSQLSSQKQSPPP